MGAKLGPAGVPILCGTDRATGITFDSGQSDTIVAQLAPFNASRAGAIRMMAAMKKFYGILDGRYLHEDIMMLMKTKESWDGFDGMLCQSNQTTDGKILTVCKNAKCRHS